MVENLCASGVLDASFSADLGNVQGVRVWTRDLRRPGRPRSGPVITHWLSKRNLLELIIGAFDVVEEV